MVGTAVYTKLSSKAPGGRMKQGGSPVRKGVLRPKEQDDYCKLRLASLEMTVKNVSAEKWYIVLSSIAPGTLRSAQDDSKNESARKAKCTSPAVISNAA